ncbi:MAG: tyrosine-type recombinase/integrase [Asticcacaulis sp.]|nr:tyrosine-type recombinase/integrase [Asticcacaulis sp.]
MRVKLKGIHKVRKTLADGSVVRYHYAWRGGPRLDGKPGTPEFMASYNEALKELRRPVQGVLATLVAEWRASTDFARLSASSRRNYDLAATKVLDRFGDMPISALDDPRVRGHFKRWRDSMAETPRAADYAATTLARILSVALDNGRIHYNYAARLGRLYSSDRAEKVWSKEQIALFVEKAPASLSLALMLALATGQREGDLLKLTWADFDGERIKVSVSKKKPGAPRVKLTIRLLDYAADALNSLERTSTHILTNSRGLPWTASGFRASWRKAFGKIFTDTDLHFHDLRGTAITQLTIAGCTTREIASITGHSEKTVEAVLNAHYLGDQTPLAERAIARLNENGMGMKTVNRL